MTRDSFRSLEGELVVFDGRLAKAGSRNADGLRRYMFTSIRAWKWDNSRPVPWRQPPHATADHCWVVEMTVDDDYRGGDGDAMLRRGSGVARIHWYARADGSADLGLELKPCANLDGIFKDSPCHDRNATRADQIDWLTETLEYCNKRELYTYSAHYASSEMLKRWARHLERLKRSEEREQQIRRTQPPSRKPTSAKSFSDLLHKL
jgi:hypothetical protein